MEKQAFPAAGKLVGSKKTIFLQWCKHEKEEKVIFLQKGRYLEREKTIFLYGRILDKIIKKGLLITYLYK